MDVIVLNIFICIIKILWDMMDNLLDKKVCTMNQKQNLSTLNKIT